MARCSAPCRRAGAAGVAALLVLLAHSWCSLVAQRPSPPQPAGDGAFESNRPRASESDATGGVGPSLVLEQQVEPDRLPRQGTPPSVPTPGRVAGPARTSAVVEGVAGAAGAAGCSFATSVTGAAAAVPCGVRVAPGPVVVQATGRRDGIGKQLGLQGLPHPHAAAVIWNPVVDPVGGGMSPCGPLQSLRPGTDCETNATIKVCSNIADYFAVLLAHPWPSSPLLTVPLRVGGW